MILIWQKGIWVLIATKEIILLILMSQKVIETLNLIKGTGGRLNGCKTYN